MTSANVNIVDVIAERLKAEPIGGLIKEEDLYDIVKAAMAKAFTDPVVENVQRSYGGYDTVKHDNLVVKMVRDLLTPHLKEAVEKWAAENGDQLMAVCKEIVERDHQQIVFKTLSELLAVVTSEGMVNLSSKINDTRMKLGMPIGSNY